MKHGDEDTVDELPAPPRKDIQPADLELLELAARALGATFEEVDGEGYGNLHFADGRVVNAWNPLQFWGDTFEMAVKLDIAIERLPWDRDSAHAHAYESPVSFFEPRGEDPVAATARAVTRAAAEIGKAMA
jgi:hypothetical protein